MPRCAAIARCGACSVEPAHSTMRLRSPPPSCAVAPDRDFHARFLHRALDLAEAVHHLTVDRQQQVPGLQQLRGRSAGDEAADPEHLAARRAVLLDAIYPLLVETEAPRRRERHDLQLRLERMQRTAV